MLAEGTEPARVLAQEGEALARPVAKDLPLAAVPSLAAFSAKAALGEITRTSYGDLPVVLGPARSCRCCRSRPSSDVWES